MNYAREEGMDREWQIYVLSDIYAGNHYTGLIFCCIFQTVKEKNIVDILILNWLDYFTFFIGRDLGLFVIEILVFLVSVMEPSDNEAFSLRLKENNGLLLSFFSLSFSLFFPHIQSAGFRALTGTIKSEESGTLMDATDVLILSKTFVFVITTSGYHFASAYQLWNNICQSFDI